MQNALQGRYRTPASSGRGAMAYVIDGRNASYISEEAYREKKYRPEFEALPTEDEYDG
jgi:hypothetical protein